MVGRRISAARATIWMTGRKTSGYGSFRLGKGLSNLTRTKHRPLFSQVLKNDDTRPVFAGGCFCADQSRQLRELLGRATSPSLTPSATLAHRALRRHSVDDPRNYARRANYCER